MKYNIKRISNLSKSKRYKLYRDIYLDFTQAGLNITEFSTLLGTDKSVIRSILDAGKMITDHNLYID